MPRLSYRDLTIIMSREISRLSTTLGLELESYLDHTCWDYRVHIISRNGHIKASVYIPLDNYCFIPKFQDYSYVTMLDSISVLQDIYRQMKCIRERFQPNMRY